MCNVLIIQKEIMTTKKVILEYQRAFAKGGLSTTIVAVEFPEISAVTIARISGRLW